MKTCTKCKKEKELSEFTKLKRSKDGLYPQCRTCKLEYWKNNRDHELARNSQWKKDNREKVKKTTKKWIKANPNKVKKYKAADYQNNKEKCDKRNREWAKKNPEKIKEYDKRTREKESFKEWRRKYQIKRKIHATIKGKARKAINESVRQGKLIKPKNCQMCNSEENIEAHHADYEKFLEVLWVCRRCHRWIHTTLNRKQTT